ncbi:divergent polysaccharide deacetylase family protein [Bacillus sp. SCS-153A]|uniref:divergent polysaccharide deacetylase family protein n=1 Tax=Rossellomorea sedimentorum TaxID=3115294 RepID=UPI003906C6E2
MKKIIVCSILALLFTAGDVTAEGPKPSSLKTKSLSIVIDDFGNNMQGTKEMLELPISLTAAVMPLMETTKKDAELAHRLGHEVIVHMPMEPVRGKRSWLGPGAITIDLSDEEIRKRVEEAIESVPHAVGMNHHMGSKATANERVMRVVLTVCKEKGLYYLDSRTTPKSVIPELAEELGVPLLKNELFFDDVYTTQHIVKQAGAVAKRLKKDEEVIAIGHVGITGTKMVNVLKEYIPVYLNEAKAVPLSELIPEFELVNERLE